jgi:flap endonuclease-1
MGIKDLPKLIKLVAGDYAIKEYEFSQFRGMKVGVDVSFLIYQYVIAIRNNGRDMKNKNGEITSHLYGIFYKTLSFLENDMIPIFVFDGKAPEIKRKIIDIRKDQKKSASEKLKDLDEVEDEDYIKTFKKTFSISKTDSEEAKILLDLMGIPYITAPEEADVVLAWLASRYDNKGKRYIKGVCSDDSDILAFGASYLFKNMLKNMNKKLPITVISLRRTLDKMELNMKEFVNLCSLLGTDYCPNIRGVGPKRAYTLIKQYKKVEKIFDKLQIGNDEDEKCIIEARNYFLEAPRELDDTSFFSISRDQLELRKYQHDELVDFLCDKHGFDYGRTVNAIKRLEKCYQNLKVKRKNNSKVHLMSRPLSENYLYKATTEDIDFTD